MISLVIPVFNEEESINELYERSTAALSKINEPFEIICVDDGSEDRTLELLLSHHENDNRFKVISFSRNFGHQAAILAGLKESNGDFIGVMDGDLQDPPELFEKFYNKLLEGYDAVYAVRKKRKESRLKKSTYWVYYRLLKYMSKAKIPVDSGDFSMIRRNVLDNMLKLPEQSPFLRGVRHWVGFKQIGVEYERKSRHAGEPKYSFRSLLKLAYNGIFGFSDLPIKLLGRIGLLTVIGSLIYALYLMVAKLIWNNVPEGFTTLILAIFFFGGVQLIAIRILGEYVHRIFEESRRRPNYIIKEKYF